ncbi:MAG: alcohol dehydrogenase catalytic domain-containing protein [Candidatus Rokubacteria bacterium]|nr:alcohol dehydrogenase catalytic domain-containing protein [Candidatus Rokubacteria bacterium]
MKAAVYHDTADIRIEAVPDPILAAGELILEVHAAGICGTDVTEYLRGPIQYPIHSRHPVTGHLGPMIPGHEVAGRIVAMGAGVDGFEVGQVVASGAGISCGTCEPCAAGQTNLCVHYCTVGLERHGGLAQFCAVPASTCLSGEPLGLDEETAALAQPMAIAVHSMRRGRLRPQDEAVIIGAGGIGAFLTYAAAALGARVTVVDVVPERLRLAADLGAAETLLPTSDSPLAEQLRDRGVQPAVVYEVVGGERTVTGALEAVLPGGRVVLVGLHDDPRSLDLRRVTTGEMELVGTKAHACGVDLPEALRLLGSRRGRWTDIAPTMLPLERLVEDGILPIAERRSDRVKTLIDPWAAASRGRAR